MTRKRYRLINEILIEIEIKPETMTQLQHHTSSLDPEAPLVRALYAGGVLGWVNPPHNHGADCAGYL